MYEVRAGYTKNPTVIENRLNNNKGNEKVQYKMTATTVTLHHNDTFLALNTLHLLLPCQI